MTSLPSGLASISSRLDDTPNVRGAVDMAKRLRRAEALSALAEMDAEMIGSGEFDRMVETYLPAMAAVLKQRRAEFASDTLGSAINRHAALVISTAYRSPDTRAIVFRQGGVEVVKDKG